ncbi:pyruvate dehydrogenase (acetyl-transferring) E1 component subunit alpha [Deinococcus metallilatus]|uniref:Pyruvate dehydrogenase E1 component subunit alpha n=1 Tax=Deinococcus metallilatus TaxID=1211322 RepID=A0AAJ5F1S8_9DEIO|nr:pyruvate dehydrogenase (acetyl-transferring) E1 component subunit alpha [Deinococcus metallilatus]MBB5295891.1 pyruvate dehydrogenase E1 component alpha subunit [Deinococcus metallilatus]QBY08274.1 pyruvate dehydrogenase (acetyl-transferring) E1 component subunit alpha [Deinococcus metallilatus]RXJ12005.1 pyruvate dehydrogenase (acetyl-transferring) E1 component subunit alpha [Deinococcus metallilatus]TLK25763.1 pyruvate dehydrogenase (acetyl-transferring) E1 component subunit alpha [Deinoco
MSKPKTKTQPKPTPQAAGAAAYEGAQGEMFQLVTPEGTAPQPELLPDVPTRLKLYRLMRRARHFDERAWVLYRTGRMGVFPPYGGMEASQVGTAAALTHDDWLFPTYRDTGAALTYGLPIPQTIAYWRTSPHGWAMPQDLKVLPFYIPIATQYPQAVGAALAEKRKGTRNVAMAYIGDGGSSEGDFHEALNFAGALGAPCVFVLQNNGWAISVPTRTQTRATNLSLRAEGYGIPGVRVDGNDVLATYHVALEAVNRARNGEGPTLIETVTYRVKPHTVADDPSRYRTDADTAGWDAKDPVQRLRTHLLAEGHLTEEQDATVTREIEAEFEAALQVADAFPEPTPAEIVDHVFAEPTPQLVRQRAQIMAEEGA